MTAKQLANRLEKLNLEQITLQAVMKEPEAMPDLNREQLYQFGQDSTGSKLRPYKRIRYARAKHYMNPAPGLGNPDFYVTGAFQKGIAVSIEGDKVSLTSKDSKARFLEKRDPDVFGLTDKNMIRYRKVLYPDIMRIVRKQVTGK